MLKQLFKISQKQRENPKRLNEGEKQMLFRGVVIISDVLLGIP